MSHCHTPEQQCARIAEGGRRVVLAGNPNSGKSVLFHRLTGIYAEVSNYPGTTLEIASGQWGPNILTDTPGVYGLSAQNPEERVAREIILQADVAINVVNALHLERDLFLTQQIIDAGIPVIVALNMVDETEARGLKLDPAALSEELGVPVVATVATTGRGVGQLRARLNEARPGRTTPALQQRLRRLGTELGDRRQALLALEGEPAACADCLKVPAGGREESYRLRRERVNQVVARIAPSGKHKSGPGDRLGRWLVRPWPGLLILALTLYATYKVIGVFVAGTVVGLTEETIMQGLYEPLVRSAVGAAVAPESPAYVVLAGEFGVLTMTVTYILGLLLPLVGAFYFFLSLFEDSGYLPRIATLLDRLLTGIGLNGKAVIPFILGFGCVTMATIVTRLLPTVRERRIATYLLVLAVPCSAQLAVITALLAALAPGYALTYAAILLAIFIIAGTALDALMPGQASDLFLDLPPLRWPRLANVLKKTWLRTYHFLREASPLFAVGAAALSILDVTGGLATLHRWLEPLAVGWLRLPPEASQAFVMGFVRRDFGAAGLLGMPLTGIQVVVALVVITLFVPCIAAAMVLFKERGKAEGAAIWVAAVLTAFLIGGAAAQLAAAGQAMGLGEGGQLVLLAMVFAGLTLLARGAAALVRRAAAPRAATRSAV